VLGFRLSAEKPPDATRVNDAVVSRYEHVFEVDPVLMTEHVHQQELSNWEIHRIVESRWEHLAWMHDHWADSRLSGEELLQELEAEERAG
jgi:hypothetical protein